MTKKGRSLVDSFVFHKAKEAVDHVTKPPEKEQDHIKIISGSEQEHNNIIKGADKEQILN